MGDASFHALSSWAERREALRVPVRGVAVCHLATESVPEAALFGQLENLSQGGALVNLATCPSDHAVLDVELKLPVAATGWISAHTVRVERASQRSTAGEAPPAALPVGSAVRASGWRVGIAFDRVDSKMRQAIDETITAALEAARRRPILVIDDHAARRDSLIQRLAERGMTPLAPRTPLDAIDLLTRSQLHVTVCLLAPSFGVPSTDLAAALSESFPWITAIDITDDSDATTARALEAWSATPVARIATAIG